MWVTEIESQEKHNSIFIQLFAKQTHYILVDCQKSIIKHYKLDKQLKCDAEEKLFGQFIIQNCSPKWIKMWLSVLIEEIMTRQINIKTYTLFKPRINCSTNIFNFPPQNVTYTTNRVNINCGI